MVLRRLRRHQQRRQVAELPCLQGAAKEGRWRRDSDGKTALSPNTVKQYAATDPGKLEEAEKDKEELEYLEGPVKKNSNWHDRDIIHRDMEENCKEGLRY
jgi:hypothetical protein